MFLSSIYNLVVTYIPMCFTSEMFSFFVVLRIEYVFSLAD